MILTVTEIWRKLEMTERTLILHFPWVHLAKDWWGTFCCGSRRGSKGLLPVGGTASWFSTSFDALETRLWYKGFCRKNAWYSGLVKAGSCLQKSSGILKRKLAWNCEMLLLLWATVICGLCRWLLAHRSKLIAIWMWQWCRPEGKAICTPSYVTVVI